MKYETLKKIDKSGNTNIKVGIKIFKIMWIFYNLTQQYM